MSKQNAMSAKEFLAHLDAGAYVWPGGYPLYFVLNDGEALSFEAAQEEREQVLCDLAQGWGDFLIVAVDVNWENDGLTCVHTGRRIEAAYC